MRVEVTLFRVEIRLCVILERVVITFVPVEIKLRMKLHSTCINHTRPCHYHTRECHIYTHVCQNYSRVCRNHTLRVKLHIAGAMSDFK
jgi:hypothetical protein